MRPRNRREGKKKEVEDDSILRDSFYVAVSVYAPDFSTYPRAFEVPSLLRAHQFLRRHSSPSFLLPSLPLDFLKNDL